MNQASTPSAEALAAPVATVPAGLKDYIAIARPDNWAKNVFMLPGVLFAFIVYRAPVDAAFFLKLVMGLTSTCLVASANYVINEYLDAEFDKFHPLKSKRTSVVRVVNPVVVYAEWLGLALVGFALAYQISVQFLAVSMFLLFMGVMYNVRPFRTKERVYLDVLSESVNNPIRFALGWFIVAPALSVSAFDGVALFNSLPPSSIIVAYWMGGAFLMATKRFAEYRLINNPELAGLYRKSFRFYTEHSLLISMFFYALTSAFFLGIFLVKNRVELLLSFPFFALLFAWYLRIGLLDNSPVQGSEKLYTRKWFMLYVGLFCTLLVVLMFVKIPFLGQLLEDHYNLNHH
ncbi:prenyltransferase [Hymenobacter setariae]|uniref:Prenyltransferase n=1 Tax=Hymenobacter setariae TaxID=2594794 RepID=A0A558C3W2_9BACT|nr:UbiA family prenyltransferase [Hymenobacter setariae]TVT43473.1 prenyltransferase [Hymenobacter setariae]